MKPIIHAKGFSHLTSAKLFFSIVRSYVYLSNVVTCSILITSGSLGDLQIADALSIGDLIPYA